jgi:hypothetical protein
MLGTKRLGCLTATMLLTGLLACGQTSQAADELKGNPADQFVVGPSEVLVPKDVFLLVRKGRKIGTIRFTSIEQGSTAGTGKASYESYFQGDGSGSFRSPNVRKQTGGNDVKPLKGIGRLAFQVGKDRIRVGDWSFLSSSPGAVSMWPYRGSQKDYGYEFAPTSAQNIRDVDTTDKGLKWFRYDNNSSISLPVAGLPK